MDAEFLRNLIQKIEIDISTDSECSIASLSACLGLSKAHLQRLFKFAFDLPLATYIRSRRLAYAAEQMLKSDNSILLIALRCQFEHEQSFSRAFKNEFGLTPGDYRKNPVPLKIIPALNVKGLGCYSNGLLFEPEVVYMPPIFLAGRQYAIPYRNARRLAPAAALEFWDTHRPQLLHAKDDGVFYGLTHKIEGNKRYSHYLTAVEMKQFAEIPDGFVVEKLELPLCIRFHYIGRHHYREINAEVAGDLYKAIRAFQASSKLYSINEDLFLEKIDTRLYDGVFCTFEWFAPLLGK